MTEPKFPREIKPETWRKVLEEMEQEEAEEAKLRKPREPPIVSTVEQQILDDILEEKEQEKQQNPGQIAVTATPAYSINPIHRTYRPADSGCDDRQVITGLTAATCSSLSNWEQVSKRLGCRLPVLIRGLHPDRRRAEAAGDYARVPI